MVGHAKLSAIQNTRSLLQQQPPVSWTCWPQQHQDPSPPQQQGGRHPLQLLQHLPHHHHLLLIVLVNVELLVTKLRRDGNKSWDEMEESSVPMVNPVTLSQFRGKLPSHQEEGVDRGVEEPS